MSNGQSRAAIAAEHLVGNLWFNLDAVSIIAGRLEPDTMRLIVGGPAAMAYSEMCRLMRSPSEQLSAGALEANLRQQGFDFNWLGQLQARIAVEGLDVLHNYAGEINNAADLYRIRMYCADADKKAALPDAKADIIAAGLLTQLADANKTAIEVEHISTVGQRVREQLARIRSGATAWGASTGFRSLDRVFRMTDGDLITIAGRPSQGKSSLARQIFYNRARQIAQNGENAQVVIFTADDTSEKLHFGLACTVAGVDAKRIRSQQASAEEWDALERAMAHIDALPIQIDGTAAPTTDAIYYRCAMLNAQKRVVLAGMDYLSRTKTPKAYSELDAVRNAAEGYKGIGQTLRFPFLLLSQIGKSVEDRRDRWPTPSDLLYAGEAESDICMLVMRPEHYISRGEDIECAPEDREGIALVNVGKNKQGDIGMVRMAFHKEYSRFADLAYQDESQAPAKERRQDLSY